VVLGDPLAAELALHGGGEVGGQAGRLGRRRATHRRDVDLAAVALDGAHDRVGDVLRGHGPDARRQLRPVSWNMPASRTKPGKIALTPTPVGRRSSRRLCAKPAQAELRRAVDRERGVPTLPASEDMKTRWPLPRATMPPRASAPGPSARAG
jgi:hypothetical protein